jgi:tubulin polyglutamylase TTLL4
MNNFKDMYIFKPTASSCGRGIRIISKKQNVSKRPGTLVQKYISKPHLLRGYKYDMRLYILVTSFEPLKAYIFEQGLVRLATVPYSTAKGNLKKRFIHLTNFSVNKKNEQYKKNTTQIINKDGSIQKQEKNDKSDNKEAK